MQERLIGIAKIVGGLEDIHHLMQKHPELIKNVPSLTHIATFFNEQKSSELQRLLKLLRKRTFKGKPSYFFSNTVRILLAFKLMESCKGELTLALEAAGELDAMYSVSRLLNNNNKAQYCFVEFVNNEKPIIKFEAFWNPLMDANKVEINSVHLGKTGDHNMMITGPNGSGKSTNMKAITLNILLGQTFGIAAAKRAIITPFDKINSYLNVQENLKQGMSTFMAEAQRLEEICQIITSIPKNKKCFTIIDEGLRGTVAEEGVKRICNMMRNIIQSDQSICILATHFKQPTYLEKETGRISNYYVTIEEPSFGKFIRAYKFERGVNNWWFNDQQKRQRFIDWLIKIGHH